MKREYVIGVVIGAILAVALTVILTFNLLQPLTNNGLVNATNLTTGGYGGGNWGAYTGALQLVQTQPIFNSLLPLLVSISAMLAILGAAGLRN